jgi:hypothetical protein
MELSITLLLMDYMKHARGIGEYSSMYGTMEAELP